jgi:hypothetical protein
MSVLAAQPVLAKIDAEAIITIVVAFIGFVSWVVNQLNSAKGKNPPAKPVVQRRPAARRDEKVFEEISIFLEQTEKRPAGQQSRKGKPVGQPRPAAGRQAPVGKLKSGTGPPRPPARPIAISEDEARQTHRPPGGEIARRKLSGAENLGSQVRQHVSEMQKSRVEAYVAQDMKNRIASDVKADLGEFSAGATVPATDQTPPSLRSISPQRLAEFLRQPGNMRQAIVLNLILTPPPGLRRK